MKLNNFPIGIFDSGIGGVSIWEEVSTVLPSENTLYLADSKNAPYGQKSKKEIIALSIKNTEFLLAQNCKIIIVACNTATTNAIKTLRDSYPVPFIGIEPAIKPAALRTKTNSIGILATKGTLSSDLFEKTSRKIDEKISITEIIGKGLVELIEEKKIDSREMTALLKKHLNPIISKKLDCLVLGCTHYSYLIPQIRKIVGTKIQIIDSGQAVARQTKMVLESHSLVNTSNKGGIYQFYTNKDKSILTSVLSQKNKKYKSQQEIFRNFQKKN